MTDNIPQEMNAADNDADVSAEAFQEIDEAVAEPQDEMSELGQLKMELAEAQKNALLAAADLENYRKRASKNAQEQVKYASLPLMTELLETMDNLHRAIEAAEDNEANSALLEGVTMVADQVLNILKANHCQPIESVGQPFDPNLHQAVQMQNSDEFPANTVMLELRTGYKLHDRVIRPSQVFVSTGPAE